jgi:hypothetical protein
MWRLIVFSVCGEARAPLYWRMRAPTVARLIERNNALSVESKSILCHFLFETLFLTSALSAVSPLLRFNDLTPRSQTSRVRDPKILRSTPVNGEN